MNDSSNSEFNDKIPVFFSFSIPSAPRISSSNDRIFGCNFSNDNPDEKKLDTAIMTLSELKLMGDADKIKESSSFPTMKRSKKIKRKLNRDNERINFKSYIKTVNKKKGTRNQLSRQFVSDLDELLNDVLSNYQGNLGYLCCTQKGRMLTSDAIESATKLFLPRVHKVPAIESGRKALVRFRESTA